MLDYEEALQIANDYVAEHGLLYRACNPRVSDDDWIFFLYPIGNTGDVTAVRCLFIDRKTRVVEDDNFVGQLDRGMKAERYTAQ